MLNLDFSTQAIKFLKKLSGKSARQVKKKIEEMRSNPFPQVSNNPNPKVAKHLKVFMSEYSNARSGLIVCTTDVGHLIEKNIRVINYKNLAKELKQWSEK